jgi:hypothetical protein
MLSGYCGLSFRLGLERKGMYAGYCWGSDLENDYQENLEVDGRIMLRVFLGK